LLVKSAIAFNTGLLVFLCTKALYFSSWTEAFARVEGGLATLVLFVSILVFSLLLYSRGCRRTLFLRGTKLSILFLLCGVGFGWAGLAEKNRSSSVVLKQTNVVWVGVVEGMPLEFDDVVVFSFRVLADDSRFSVGARALKVRWGAPPVAVLPGQKWVLPLHVVPNRSIEHSGAGFVRSGVLDPVLVSQDWSYHSFRMELRERILQSVGGNLGKDQGRAVPVLLALVLGDRSLLTDKHWQLFSDTGTSHLIAISGLHIGLIFGLVYFAVLYGLIFCQLQIPTVQNQVTASICAVLVAWLYGALAGYSIPTQRACVMVSAVVLLRYMYPTTKKWAALFISATFVLLFEPFAILRASFWLSFFAVILILLVLDGRVFPFGKLLSWGRVQAGLFIGLLPLSAHYFGKVVLIGVLANVVAIPLVGWVVVPLSLLYSLLVLCGELTGGVTLLLYAALEGVMYVFFALLTELQSWGGALFFASPSIKYTFAALVGAVILCLPSAFPGRWLGVLLILPLLLDEPHKSESSTIDIVGLDQRIVIVELESDLLLIVPADRSSGRVNYLVRQYFRDQGISNRLKEPIFGVYRQWISDDYAVMRVKIRNNGWRRREAVSIEGIAACSMLEYSIEDVVISPGTQAGGRCYLTLRGGWGRALLLAPGDIDEQLAFIASYEVLPEIGYLDTLFIEGRQRLSGALLNHVSPHSIEFLIENNGSESLLHSLESVKVRNIVLN